MSFPELEKALNKALGEAARLRDQNELLVEQIHVMRSHMVPPGRMPTHLGLTPREADIFKALLSREQCSREQLLVIIWSDGFPREVPDTRVIDTHVSRLRRKLRPHRIGIESLRSCGYRMNAAQREKAKEFIDQLAVEETGRPFFTRTSEATA